jgi:hypothetical protein
MSGLARDLQNTFDKQRFIENLDNLRWLFLLMAFTIRMSIAAVERQHAAHHRCASLGNGSKPFHTFAADSLLCEARDAMCAAQRLQKDGLSVRLRCAIW